MGQKKSYIILEELWHLKDYDNMCISEGLILKVYTFVIYNIHLRDITLDYTTYTLSKICIFTNKHFIFFYTVELD